MLKRSMCAAFVLVLTSSMTGCETEEVESIGTIEITPTNRVATTSAATQASH